MPRLLIRRSIAAAVAMGVATAGHAAVITFSGATTEQSGTGFGNALHVLTLHDAGRGADGLEAGSVVWNGTGDVYGTVGGGSDTKSQQSQTRTVAELLAEGIDGTNLAVIFNLSQQGSSQQLNLSDFFLRFQDASGATLFDAQFDADDPANAGTTNLVPVGQGVGSAGYLFPVQLTAAEIAQFFGDPTNRLGLYVNASNPISGATGGPEVFFVGQVPEPGTACVAAAGMLGLLLRRRRV